MLSWLEGVILWLGVWVKIFCMLILVVYKKVVRAKAMQTIEIDLWGKTYINKSIILLPFLQSWKVATKFF